MKRKGTLLKTAFLTLAIVLFTALTLKFTTEAGALSAAYLYLSRIQVNMDGTSTGQQVQMVLAIDTSQTIPSGGTITIEFPDGEDTSWCRTAGALAVTAVSSSAADMATTNWDIDSSLPNDGTALAGTCAQGAGASSVDTITITHVGALTTGTTYGVSLSGNVGKIGTTSAAGEHEVTITAKNGTTIDSKTFKLYLIADDTVTVSATVSAVPTVSCSISATTINLGTLYPGGAYATANHTISTSSSGSGYYWAAYGEGDGSTDAGLWKSSATTYLIQSGATSTLDLTGVNAEGFGITVSQPSGATVPSAFSNAVTGTFGTLDRGVSGAKMILYQNGSQGSAEDATITYGARASTSAQAGAYTENVTYVCGGYF